MLILTRRVGEWIYIGQDIKVCVTGIREGKVRIGIVAPPEIPVNRQEVHEAIHGKKETQE